MFTLQDIAYIIFNTKIPDLGYLFISNTVLIFISEFKNGYENRKLKRAVKNLEKRLKDKQ